MCDVTQNQKLTYQGTRRVNHLVAFEENGVLGTFCVTPAACQQDLFRMLQTYSRNAIVLRICKAKETDQ